MRSHAACIPQAVATIRCVLPQSLRASAPQLFLWVVLRGRSGRCQIQSRACHRDSQTAQEPLRLYRGPARTDSRARHSNGRRAQKTRWDCSPRLRASCLFLNNLEVFASWLRLLVTHTKLEDQSIAQSTAWGALRRGFPLKTGPSVSQAGAKCQRVAG